MLIHHLFYGGHSQALYDGISFLGYGVINQLGLYGKLCVAIFVFLSGYGLMKKYGTDFSCKTFYLSRLKRLYFNYWFIWLVFVPIGVFVFHRNFVDVYNDHIIIKVILDLLGLLNITGLHGYNPTWWFYSCIIILYMLYPVLAKAWHRYLLLILSLCAIFPLCSFIIPLRPICNYLLPFVAGMYLARSNVPVTNPSAVLFAFILLSAFRNLSGIMVYAIDTLICVCLASFLSTIEMNRRIKRVLINLGRHSTNIFLFHTFIFYYWFEDLVYITRNPIIIFISLIVPCYVISVVLEYIKTKVMNIARI